jgi:hypothetical protein
MGGFSTWLYYLFVKIFVYCIIIVQIANKVENKKAYLLKRKRVSASRCLATDVSAVFLWLHTSGFQVSCHSTSNCILFLIELMVESAAVMPTKVTCLIKRTFWVRQMSHRRKAHKYEYYNSQDYRKFLCPPKRRKLRGVSIAGVWISFWIESEHGSSLRKAKSSKLQTGRCKTSNFTRLLSKGCFKPEVE